MDAVKRLLPTVAWGALVLSLLAAAAFGWQWACLHALNRMIADGSLIEQPQAQTRASAHYAAAWLYERAGQPELALQSYAEAESGDDARISARAKVGLGNHYLYVALRAGDIAAGGSHVRALAQLELAREAYRGALRIDPELREARYNLELLERLSPLKRTQGWSRPQRNLQMQQGQEQGWAAMQESSLRGLP